MAGYDPKKAATFNQLKQQGLSDSEAQAQAGITKEEKKSYQINYVGNNDPKSASYNPNYGKVGPQVTGENKATYDAAIKSGQTEEQAYATLQAKQADYAATNTFQVGDVATNEKTPPDGSVAPQSQTTTSDTISSGGTTTRIAGQKVDTPASTVAQKQADAKQAELDNFYANNPSNAERAMDGLPPLTPAESKARLDKINQLQDETAASQAQANSLKASTQPTTVVTSNTTTSENTTTYETTAQNTAVSAPAGADPVVNQQAGTQLVNNNVPAGSLTPVPEAVASPQVQPVASVVIAADAPQPVDETGDQPLLAPEQSIAQAQGVRLDVPTDDPAAAAADFNAQTNQNVQNAIGVKQPAPVDANNTGSGQQGQSTISGARGGNVQENEQLEAARQAAQEAQLKQEAAVAAELALPANGDWRVRLRLAPGATYLYKDTNVKNGILAPLAASGGVVFPYMPNITTSYNANYDQTDLTHSNYRGQFYKSSYVGDINISGEFTAQDTAEANYLLAVIHFFRSVTKMFYGAKDSFRGTPPPLVYLMGLGQYQFNNQPCVVKTFNYSMPNNCDYIRTKPNNYNVNLGDRQTKPQTSSNPFMAVIDRLKNAGLKKGALPTVPSQTLLDLQSVYNIDNATYVPTRCEVSITLMPIQTRNQQSTLFNMEEYASGQLLKGGFW